jgi:hypothetical protein
LKSLQPTENDRPKSENDTANYFHAVVALWFKKNLSQRNILAK